MTQATTTADNDRPLGSSGITLGQLRRTARLYHRNIEAAQALGITVRSFSRLCRQHGIQTPYARKQNRRP